MSLIKNRTIAITNNIWMKLPKTWNPKKPISQRIMRMVAIVVNIGFRCSD